jgi:hypothetical protein
MSERYAGRFGLIDSEALRNAARYDSADDIDIRRMADELTARRAADLSEEDAKALRNAKDILMAVDQGRPGIDESIAILDRLVKGAGQ